MDDLGLTNIKQKVLTTLSEFVMIQEEQLSNLRSEKVKNVRHWRGQRLDVFNRLQYYLETLNDYLNEGTDKKFLSILHEKMGYLLQRESELNQLADRQKNKVGEALRSLRKGRQAVKGYSMTKSTGVKSQFLNNRS